MYGKRVLAWLLAAVLALSCGIALGESAVTTTQQTAEAVVQTTESQTHGSEDERIEAFLKKQAEAQKDAWVRAILEAGARNVSWNGNTATFSLRSFDPGLKTLGGYARAADQAVWRQQALANIAAYSLELSVTFEEDGTPGKKQTQSFLNKVKAAASGAKGAFGKKDMKSALSDLMFCTPTNEKKASAASLMTASDPFAAFIAGHPEIFPCENASEWAPMLYLQRNTQFGIKQGPHALQMSWDGVNPDTFLNQAYDNATSSLASVSALERTTEENLPYLWRSTLAETAIKARKGRLAAQKAELDIDDLVEGRLPVGYAAYFARYNPQEYYDRLQAGYHQMPEYASQPMPKSGTISQAKKGRTLMIKNSKDGRNTYIQLRDADTGVIHAEAFLLPGDVLNLKVPEGVYVVQYASGSTWYGTVNTFGPMGTYLASEEFIVAKNKWVLTAGQEQAGIRLHETTAEAMGPTEDKSIHVQGTLEATAPLQAAYPANPVISGISPTTGLPASGESYTPIVMVLDNAEDAYPHWGVAQADILFQVPNAGSGATKLLALFADHYPAQAGPVRSGRSTMLPAALSFQGAIAFAGPPAVTGGEIDILAKMTEFGMTRTHRVYNLLNNNGYAERWKEVGSHNMSCHIAEIHSNLVSNAVEFEERPFQFTDEPRTEGAVANIVRVLHRGEDPKGASNSASRAVFKYNAEKGTYTRNNSSGVYIDRLTGETVEFANVIVIRAQLSYDRNYLFFKNFMAGSGAAEIFQNGRYVRGAWCRADQFGRLVLVDQDGSELKLQRGKTFIVLTNDITDVIYSE